MRPPVCQATGVMGSSDAGQPGGVDAANPPEFTPLAIRSRKYRLEFGDRHGFSPADHLRENTDQKHGDRGGEQHQLAMK